MLRILVTDEVDPEGVELLKAVPEFKDALESLKTKRDKNPPKKHGNIPL
jgi:hypothetical protein